MAQKIESKQERPLQTYFLKNFLAVNTVASRPAEPQDACFYDLTNSQPIGFSNLHSIADAGPMIHDFADDRVFADFNVNINNTEYLLIATRRTIEVNGVPTLGPGSLWAYQITPGPGQISAAMARQVPGQIAQIGSGLSGTDALDIVQFDNTTALIIDSSGYYKWVPGPFDPQNPGAVTQMQAINTPTSHPLGGATITNGGTGYTNPTVTFSGGGGSGAAATVAQASGVIQSITFTNFGTGYTSAPTITVHDSTGTGAAITAQLSSAPTHGQAIAVYNNMVWIAQGRTIYNSAPGPSSGTAVNPLPAYADFSITTGGGWDTITDSTLRSDIKALFPANGLLYVWGETSIDAISDVQIVTTTSAATSSYTRLNVSAVVGTDQYESIMAYGRLVFFANRYGVWMLYGYTVQLASTDVANSYYSGIDGTWQYLDLQHQNDAVQWVNNAGQWVDWQNNGGATVSWMLDSYLPYNFRISGAQVTSNNLLCAAFTVVRKNDPIMGSGNFLALYQGDASGSSYKWWFADWTSDIGPITHICGAFKDNAPVLFGYIDNRLYQLFADAASAPSSRIMTALWDFNDPIADKQAIRAGIRVSLHKAPGPAAIRVNLDTLTDSYPIKLGDVGTVDWVNHTEQIVPWQNAVPATVNWHNWRNFLYYHGAAPQAYSKCLGFTVNTERGTIYELNAFLCDYKIAARWVGD